MRDKLKEKYIPCHHTKLLEQYNAVRQGSSNVVDSITRFDDGRLRYRVRENPKMIITRFKMGLRPEIQKKFIYNYITTLEHIYKIALDIERYVRPMAPRPQDPRHTDVRPTSGGKPPRVGPNPSRAGPILNRGKEEAKGHPLGNLDRCYRCGEISHQSKQCPTRREHALFIENIVEEEVKRDQHIDDDEIVID